MKAHVGLNAKTKKQIAAYAEQYNKEYIEEYTAKVIRIVTMVACETMVEDYGFGRKRLPDFAQNLLKRLAKMTGVYEDSTEYKLRKDLMALGYDFDGEWAKWREKTE